MELSQIQSFKVFDTGRRVWIEVRRSTFVDPNWMAEARQQNGLIVASKVISPQRAQETWAKYGHLAEVTRLG